MTTRFTTQIAIAAFCAAVVTNAAQAQEGDLDALLYQDRCAACHGEQGHGDGPMQEILSVDVPDITGLSAANDGKFPLLDVIHIIDGRMQVRAHDAVMPSFGAEFRNELYPMVGQYGYEAIVRGRTLALAQYVEKLQQ